MTAVVVASLAVATPMGQQEYERQLMAHLPAAGVQVRSAVVRSLRSSLPGTARLPLRVASRLPAPLQNVLARGAYRTSGLVHRADLRLPAARTEVVTVHDLAPLRFPDEGAIEANALQTLRGARAVICPSHFSAGEVRELTGNADVAVVHNGLDPDVWTPSDPTVIEHLGLDAPFVLHSGGATRRKNLAGLARAWRVLSSSDPDVQLVLCGPPDDRRTGLFAGLPRVRLLGRVPRPVHLALMSAATVVVVPSTYEGFGFPALEAMARRTPVVAVDGSALREVCGGAAVLTEPDGEAIATALLDVLGSPAEAARRVELGVDHAAKFTWQAAAGQYAAIYAGALA